MTYRIFCDFDGTVAMDDVTDVLLEAFAAPCWRDIEARWRAGHFGSAECMARQVALMRCSRDALDQALDRVCIDPGFRSFVNFCERIGASLTIVSDGLDYAIKRILERARITSLTIIANRLLFVNDGRYAMLSPNAAPNCASSAGTCKCAATTRFDDTRPAVLIGDGRSDFCVAGVVDFVLAKNALLDFCRAHAIAHAAFSDFSEVPSLLADRFPAATLTAGRGDSHALGRIMNSKGGRTGAELRCGTS
jgi:2,3-diketo-5-methylthio-1-phosphopentane phosphatase